MKKLTLILCTVSLIFYTGCSNNSEEDTTIDCEAKNVSLDITNVVLPDCGTEGSFTLVASGGAEPYEYRLDNGEFQASPDFIGLAAKTYEVEVKDADDCVFKGSFDLPAEPNGISLSISSTNSQCLNDTGSITVTATGGDGTFSYSLDGGTAQTENTFDNVGTGNHMVTVTDGLGCTASTSVYVSSTISLANDIMPLLQRECTFSGCHNGDNGADRNWLEKTNVRNKAQNIKSRTQSGSMPRSPGQLTAAEIAMIACWVDDGALDN